MDQKALDDAYDQMVYAPNRDQVHKRNMFNCDRVRARLGAPKRIAYGPKPIEELDLFATIKPNAPINVFIHGGAWRQRAVKDYAFMAEMFVRAGAPLDRRSTSTASRAPRAICCRWPIRCGARSPGSTRTPRASAAIRTASTCPASRPARISPATCVTTDWYGLRRAGRRREGRAAVLGHVRPQAGAAVEALGIRRLHRRDARSSCPRSAISTGSTAR